MVKTLLIELSEEEFNKVKSFKRKKGLSYRGLILSSIEDENSWVPKD